MEWPIAILSNTHLPNQHRWLVYENPIEDYFRGLYPHAHALIPLTTNYGYLHKVTFHTPRLTPITQFFFDHYGPSPVQPETVEFRNLTTFAQQRKPLWIFTSYQTLPNVAGASTSHPALFIRLTRCILQKEESLDERLQQVLSLSRTRSASSDEGMDWESHSPCSHRY